MNTKINTSNTNWAIHGIKYAIFKRISPSLTHDLVGPLSVALIQAGLVKRKLKADNYQTSELLENSINVESYIKQTILLIRAMHSWDEPNHPIFDADNVFKQCIKLFQTRLAIKGVDLIHVENDIQCDVSDSFEGFLYCWLAVLCYLEDTTESSIALHIEQMEHKKILIMLKAEQSDQANFHLEISSENSAEHQFGQLELLELSQYYNANIEFKADSILFRW